MDERTLKQVQAIVGVQLNVPEADVRPECRFKDDLGADSLDLMELVMAFEEEYGIEIPEEEAEGIRTVQDAVDQIARRS